jgi:rubredoxin
MDSITVKTDTLISDPIVRPRSAYEISLTQDTLVFSPIIGFDNPKAGDTCPQCQASKIDYDRMLNLSCPDCGYTLAGCST